MKHDLDIPAFLRRPKGYVPNPAHYNLKPVVEPQPVKKREEKKESPEKVVNIQDRVQFRAQKVYLRLDEIFEDECWLGKVNESNTVFEYLTKNEIPAMVVSKVVPLIEERLAEYDLDDESLERKQRKRYGKFWRETLDTCNIYLANVSKMKVRKTRKKKVKSPEKKIAKFRYCEQYNPMKLASVNPTKVIGAVQVWLFNYKNKTMTVLNAIDRGGIDIKGNKFINYDEKTSKSKRVGRKTEEVIETILGKSKPNCRKAFDNVNAKELKLQNRGNPTTVILRVF